MPAVKPLSAGELDLGDQKDAVELIGPTLLGWVYRSRSSPVLYKVLPIDATSLEWRQRAKSISGQRYGSARLTRADQLHSGGTCGVHAFYLRYEFAETPVTLAEWLRTPNLMVRLECMTRVFGAVAGWWTEVGVPVLPTPAEIVLGTTGPPSILGMPFARLPDVESVFADPVRALFLPPELLGVPTGKAWSAESWQNVDRFALGVMLLLCFLPQPAVEAAEAMLARAANGTSFASVRKQLLPPFWLHRLKPTQQALSLAWRLCHKDPAVRGVGDLGQLRDQLNHCLCRLDPREAVIEVRSFDDAAAALKLLRDILLTDESYDLLVLGGETAADHAESPLEALDFYDRAIARDPNRMEAYEGQFRVLANAPRESALESLYDSDRVTGLQLDAKIWRDFKMLSPDAQLDHELALANYLRWRGQPDSAIEFIYPRLLGPGNVPLWWKIGMNLAYAEVLMLQAVNLRSTLPPGPERNAAVLQRLDPAMAQLVNVQESLKKVIPLDLLPPDEINKYGEELDELRVLGMELRKFLDLEASRLPEPKG